MSREPEQPHSPESVELTNADFAGPEDAFLLYSAGAALLHEVHDIDFHHYSDVGWNPYPNDPLSVIAQVRDLADRLAEAAKQARREVAAVERTARLAARRRSAGGQGR